MINENAFWREVLDNLPHLVLVFRVDEFDQTHLIFVSKHVQQHLGYTPREYVLASESGESVSGELDELISEVAKRSNDIRTIKSNPVHLTDKNGKGHEYEFDFQLFQTRASKTNLIAITLRPFDASTAPNVSKNVETKVVTKVKTVSIEEPIFMANSTVMKSVLKRFEDLIDQQQSFLIRGEIGTGKRTVYRKALLKAEQKGFEVFDLREQAAELTSLFDKDVDLVIGIRDLDRLDADQQEVLKDLIIKRQNKDIKTWWIASSVKNLEELTEVGQFSLELFYQMGLSSLLLPALEYRKADIPEIVHIYLSKAAHVLNLNVPDVSDDIMEQIVNGNYQHNFDDLYRLLAEALVLSDGQKFRLPAYFGKSTKGVDNQAPIKSFDSYVKEYLKRVLKHTEGKVYGKDGAAKILGMPPTTLQSKLIKYGIK